MRDDYTNVDHFGDDIGDLACSDDIYGIDEENMRLDGHFRWTIPKWNDTNPDDQLTGTDRYRK